MYLNPMWLCVTYLVGRARQRTEAIRVGNPESGALTLEWIVIAILIVAAAATAGAWFATQVGNWEGKVAT